MIYKLQYKALYMCEGLLICGDGRAVGYYSYFTLQYPSEPTNDNGAKQAD